MQRDCFSWMIACWAAMIVTSAVAGTPVASAGQTQGASVWDGVFTEEQAKRGKDAYEQDCAACHLDNLQGDDIAPALTGAAFDLRWRDLPVGDMFTAIRATMPQGAPESLSAQAYVDIVSYILQANNFPAGTEELPTDEATLSKIIVLSKQP